MIKLTKRCSALIAAMLIMLCTTATVFAESTQKLIDDAELFSSTEASDLTEQLESFSAESGWDVVVYTNYNSVSSDDMEYYYNEYYDDQGFGIGDNKSGVIFVIDMGSENRVINTKGDAMYYFDDARMGEIKSALKPYLLEYDYYGATQTFINYTKQYYESGMTEDGEYTNVKINEKADNPALYVIKHYGIVIALIALGISALVVVFIKSRYKNHGKEGTYDLNENSKALISQREDVFLHKSVTVTTTSSSSDSSSGGGGSSSSSHGSSGSF